QIAIPELVRLANQGDNGPAANILSRLGDPGVLALAALTNVHQPLRGHIDYEIRSAWNTHTVSGLIVLLKDADWNIRNAATNSLRKINPWALEHAWDAE